MALEESVAFGGKDGEFFEGGVSCWGEQECSEFNARGNLGCKASGVEEFFDVANK